MLTLGDILMNKAAKEETTVISKLSIITFLRELKIQVVSM
jgi:hypothetical protein